MLLRITLWALLIGSVIMGYLGYQTGSTTTTIVGMAAMVFIAFLLFFLIKMSLQAGLIFVKVVVIVLLIGGVVLLGIKGCSLLWNKGSQAAHKAAEQSVQIPGKIQTPSFFSNIKSFFTGKKQPDVIPMNKTREDNVQTQKPLNKISGKVTGILSGRTFQMGNMDIKLYGIDAPALTQTCLNLRGESYSCGHTSKQKLSKLLLNKTVECQLVAKIGPNDYTATCVIKGYDVGASMISIGWAVADRRVTMVYVPYETQARKQHQGLWAGKFVAPWDFRAQMAHQSRNGKKSFFDGFLK